MRHSIYFLTKIFLLIFVSSELYAQNDLFSDPSSFGITFFDGKKYEKCAMCNEVLDDYEDFNKELDKLTSVSQKIELLHDIIEKKKDLRGNVKSRIIMAEIRLLVEEKNENPKATYNLSKEEYPDIDKAKIGALEIFKLFDKAIEYAEDKNSKDYLRRVRMNYIIVTGLYDFLDDLYRDQIFDSMQETIENMTGSEKIIYETLNQDYQKTGHNPFNFYFGINLGLNYLKGKDNWLGGEFSFDLTNQKNPFLQPNHFSFFGTSYLYNVTNKSADVSLYLMQVRSIYLFQLNLIQFGLHSSSSHGSSWFYKPEIGLGFGPVSISYGYNLTFNKDVRPYTETHFISLKLNYPMIRVSQYF